MILTRDPARINSFILSHWWWYNMTCIILNKCYIYLRVPNHFLIFVYSKRVLMNINMFMYMIYNCHFPVPVSIFSTDQQQTTASPTIPDSIMGSSLFKSNTPTYKKVKDKKSKNHFAYLRNKRLFSLWGMPSNL